MSAARHACDGVALRRIESAPTPSALKVDALQCVGERSPLAPRAGVDRDDAGGEHLFFLVPRDQSVAQALDRCWSAAACTAVALERRSLVLLQEVSR